jgi:hypothetical protein
MTALPSCAILREVTCDVDSCVSCGTTSTSPRPRAVCLLRHGVADVGCSLAFNTTALVCDPTHNTHRGGCGDAAFSEAPTQQTSPQRDIFAAHYTSYTRALLGA